MSKGCLGITYYIANTKIVATGGEKPVAVDGPLEFITGDKDNFSQIR